MTGFLFVFPRVPFTPALPIEGKGRSGREAGNNEFRMAIGRGGACREGAIEDARGDETRGRFVLMASDMIWVGCFGEDGRVKYGRGSAMRPRERVDVGIWGSGGPGVGERRGGRRERLEASERVLIKECMLLVAVPCNANFCWGPPSGASRLVGVLIGDTGPLQPCVILTLSRRHSPNFPFAQRHITLVSHRRHLHAHFVVQSSLPGAEKTPYMMDIS